MDLSLGHIAFPYNFLYYFKKFIGYLISNFLKYKKFLKNKYEDL